MKPTISIGIVIESNPGQIVVSLVEGIFDKVKKELQVGKYIQIDEGNNNYVLGIITGVKVSSDGDHDKSVLFSEPIGHIIYNGAYSFRSGSSVLPAPTESVYIPKQDVLNLVFEGDGNYNYHVGRLIQNADVKFRISGNAFFSKHIGIVGSTGSGKSCAVASLLQKAVGIIDGDNSHFDCQKNAHIIIFDIHSEYSNAFTLLNQDKEQRFNLNNLDVGSLKLPYWLMNSEELETLFIESNESNSHNQVSQFKKAVILNKELHNPHINKITYDTPVYFDIKQIYNFIKNQNISTKNADTGETTILKIDPKIEDLYNKYKGISNKELDSEYRLFGEIIFNPKERSKINDGAYAGEFNRFVSRFETKLNDKRLEFILNPIKPDGSPYQTSNFDEIMKQFMGYINKSNVTIIDLSGIPFEVLSITVSLISRLIFDFAFHYTKLRHEMSLSNDIPFLVVCEEAHNYIPKHGGSEFTASKKSIERIAKEGRKYGLSLMVVSQRPSEVSDTIFSQCNNFVAMRLTNSNDQSYIKNLLPNNSNSYVGLLPTLSAGEAFIVGDATPLPSLILIDMPNPQPKSESVCVYDEWQEEWKDLKQEGEENVVSFEKVISRWRNIF